MRPGLPSLRVINALRRTTGAAVVACDLSWRFGPFDAVRGVTFEVARGEVFSLLGSEGAGKSTILLMLCTLTHPSGGRAAVSGYDVAEQPGAVRRRVALVSAGELLDGPLAAQGFRVHVPDVLCLDEPTEGLDPRARTHLWRAVRRLQVQGTTVMFATSSIDDAGQADRIAIIDAGRIVALDTPARLRATAGSAAGLDDAFIHFTGCPLRPAGDALGAARRFMARRQEAS